MDQFSTKPLEQALKSLKESIDVTEKLLHENKTTGALKNTLIAGVIQHFEFCYELSWKTLKRKLEQTTPSAELIQSISSYKALIREGAVNGYINNVPTWFKYRDKRNLTSHTYDPGTAQEVYEAACEFYNDALKLLHQLQEK